MNKTYNPATQFESIKAALNNKQTGGNRSKDTLKLEANEKPYTIRLIPNISDPAKTFLHYYSFSWLNPVSNKRVFTISPTTFGERDPIAEERIRVYRNGSETEKDQIKAIRRTENWIVNVYVVNDPVNTENNGTIKVLRFGKQLHKIITSALEGDEAEDFGSRIFDLSENGCNFKVKVEKQGEFPSYVASKFQSPKAIEGFSSSQQQETYNNIHDLTKFVTVKSYEELKRILDTEYLGIDANFVPAATPTVTEVSSTSSSSITTEEEVENILKELEKQE